MWRHVCNRARRDKMLWPDLEQKDGLTGPATAVALQLLGIQGEGDPHAV